MKQKLINILWGIISIGCIVAIWEFMHFKDVYFTKIFPPPSKFFGEIIQSDFKVGLGSQSKSVWQSILASIMRVLVGLTIGFVFAILTGVLISTNIWAERLLMPIIRLLAPIAPIAWIPLALVLFGIGNNTAFFIVFMGVFFMLSIATLKAISTVPQNYINAAKTFGFSKLQIIRNVILPCILPQVFTNLRLNFIAAWMAVLAAEMTGLGDGLGNIISTGRNLFNNEMILSGMFLIGMVGFAFDVFLKYIQDKFFWWDSI
jgi:NitT/TauT family transport system permease protein